MNRTVVDHVARIDSVDALRSALASARAAGKPVIAAGGRHAMGGQQFATGAILLDTTALNRVLDLDADAGIVEAEAGIQWPDLVSHLLRAQEGVTRPWGIAQKQTGADRFSLGGSLAANIHGRGLAMTPIVGDVESFDLMDAEGTLRRCSRTAHPDLFALAIGGYGLFGVMTAVRLRLTPRRKLERRVRVCNVQDLIATLERRIAKGFQYGDFQFAIDPASPDFLQKGICSCYRPVPDESPIRADQQALSGEDWARLLHLAHRHKTRAFEAYARHYLATDGQIYWSDTHQLADYIDDYHAALDRRSGAKVTGSEMITEVYVPRDALAAFFDGVRQDFRANDTNLIYGTVRLIEPDRETVLAWAREPWACVVFNLHVDHRPADVARAAVAFRRLIDWAAALGGSYYLTYHRWARRDQVERCHPAFASFLTAKRRHDPEERFQSDWYRHYRQLFQP
jgi:FAD/FMN-containing dehydrogenase